MSQPWKQDLNSGALPLTLGSHYLGNRLILQKSSINKFAQQWDPWAGPCRKTHLPPLLRGSTITDRFPCLVEAAGDRVHEGNIREKSSCSWNCLWNVWLVIWFVEKGRVGVRGTDVGLTLWASGGGYHSVQAIFEVNRQNIQIKYLTLYLNWVREAPSYII